MNLDIVKTVIVSGLDDLIAFADRVMVFLDISVA
jgi:predicted ABC-class ATPase